MDAAVKNEVARLLREEFQATDAESFYGMAGVHAAMLYEALKTLREERGLSEEDMEAILEELLLREQ